MEKLEKLGKYQIKRELGRGAMGVVYEAFDPLIERTVAIKTILKSNIDKREVTETFNRFRREARAAGRLSHPKIVAIYEYGEDEDLAFIVMELIRGKELKDYFDHGDRFTIKDALRIVMQILDALDFSHSRGVVHRDIKPANILITDDGQIKIADFGIAKIDASALTQAGVVLGTPTYMSPEQFKGDAVDHRADLYATGVILYQFLTGERPFTGSVITIMHQAIHQEAKPPSQLNPDVSPELDAIVRKAMAKSPEDRYQSADEFITALKTIAKSSTQTTKISDTADVTASGKFPAHPSDQTVVLPKIGESTTIRRKIDVEAWQRITNSQYPEDFVRYLQDFPAGEFAELARMRLASLERSAAAAKLEAEKLRLAKEAQARAALEEKNRKEAEQRAALEKARELAKAQAEAEAKRKREAEEKARLARQLEELKQDAAALRAREEAKRQQEAEAQIRRAKELAVTITERGKKFTAVVSEREAIAEAERKMKQEAKQRLEEEVLRRKLSKTSRLAQAEAADLAEAEAENKRQLEASEAAARIKELEEAAALAEAAERFRKEAEEKLARTQQRSRYTLMIGGTLLLIGAIVFAVFFMR